MKYLFYLVLGVILWGNSFVYSQELIDVPLNWNTQPGVMIFPSKEFEFPKLDNSFVSETEFLFLKEFKRTPSNKLGLNLVNYQTEAADKVTEDFLKTFDFQITETPVYSVTNNTKAGQPVAVLSLVPFVKVNGQVRKITSISFHRVLTSNNVTKSMDFAASSVLKEGSGEWYKISVKKDGVYKIDYAFLKSMGVNMDNLNPKHVHVYGNGFGKLPEENAEYRPDDLLKNAIYVEGEDDNKFDQSDYLLFYGKGPNKWKWNDFKGRFERILNNYATYSAYYININPNEPPSRVQLADIETNPSTHTVTDFNAYTIHEEELINIKRTGQRWYGELFDAHLTQTFSMHIPNVNPNGKTTVRSAMANVGSGGGASQFQLKYNNTTLGSSMITTAPDDNSFRRGVIEVANGVFQPTSSTFSIEVVFTRPVPSLDGYLDFIEINARSFLKYSNGLQFRDMESVGVGNVAKMEVSNFPSGGIVWEVTNNTTPKLVEGSYNGGMYSFKIASDSLRSFVAFDKTKASAPEYIGRVAHQNLHGLDPVDYLIVTNPLFMGQANRLANLHRANGLTVHVVTAQQVYNEFSGGTQDPTAIKFFAKMFFDRAEGDISKQTKYLLLFGDGTYDPLNRVDNNNNMMIMYETENSESYTASLVSDDYFAFLDDEEGFSPQDYLDIGVGRLIATTEKDAEVLVNKIEHYMKNGSDLFAGQATDCCDGAENTTHGDWRNHYTLIADDEENGYFINKDSEPVTEYVEIHHPEMNAKKIYSDAHVQVTTAGGERYPTVNNEINRTIESGTLIACYVGHGGPTGAATERIMTVGEVQDYTNIDRLTLFVSATCEFARVDDNTRVSIGEYMALSDKGGAIALMTTSRAVYFETNSKVTSHFFKNAFKRDSELKPRTFGDIITGAKNDVTSDTLFGNTDNNKRSFMLLGDPALRIALPYQKVFLDSINGVDVLQQQDTIRALSKVKMSGHVEDQYGNALNNFNGIIQPSVFDKPNDRKTLGQDAGSPVIDFQTQESVLFRGKATVQNGKYAFEFIVPKDINYSYDNGKASFYSWSETDNAGGYSNDFIIGGIDTTGLDDDEGPEIELYLNDEDFVNGGMTNETPILIAKLYDESGINTVGNGIGHDVTMILDDKTSDAKVLNDFYESDLDTYKSGQVRYQMDKLKPGLHTITFKAWDVNNNSSERRVEFNVQEEQEMKLDHVLNYPNPFTTHTEFFFEHNQVCAALETQIEIFTVTGRLVKTINQMVETRGFRTSGIPWDGRDEFGDQLARGVYVYRVSVKNPDGEKTQEMQKLYLLK